MSGLLEAGIYCPQYAVSSCIMWPLGSPFWAAEVACPVTSYALRVRSITSAAFRAWGMSAFDVYDVPPCSKTPWSVLGLYIPRSFTVSCNSS